MNEVHLDFEDLSLVLQRAEAEMGAAECHGLLCGIASVAQLKCDDAWLQQVLPQQAAGDLIADEARRALRDVCRDTLRQLDDEQLRFQLLLPDDSAPLQNRVAALAHWCQGYYMGLASAPQLKDLDDLPPDSREIIRDVVEISQAERYDQTGSEQDETAYTELVEYLRVGVLLVREELAPR